MSGSFNSSFIPKRNPVQGQKAPSPRPIFVGTLLVRIFFFAILIATLIVLFLEKKLENDLAGEKIALSSAVSSFDDASMQNIITMSNRLNQTKSRLDHTVSLRSVFKLLEESTLGTVQINHLTIKKPDDSKLTLDVNMQTNSFDAILFQRKVLGGENKLKAVDGEGNTQNVDAAGDSKLKIVNIKDLVINNEKTDNRPGQTASKFSVAFKADIALDAVSVPHQISAVAEAEKTETPQVSETVVNESLPVDSEGNVTNQNN